MWAENGCASSNELEEYDFSRLPRNLNLERQRSCDERSLGFSPHPAEHLNFDTSFFSAGLNTPPSSHFGFGDPNPIIAEAWDNVRRSLVFFRGNPVGTIAALDTSDDKLNYDQVPFTLLNHLC